MKKKFLKINKLELNSDEIALISLYTENSKKIEKIILDVQKAQAKVEKQKSVQVQTEISEMLKTIRLLYLTHETEKTNYQKK